VERNTSETGSETCCAAAVGAYERASSMSAAVPDALSFKPLSSPLSSRWAMTTISPCGERPAFSAARLTRVVRRPWIVAVNRSERTLKPYGCSWSRNQLSAPRAPSVPGCRFG
jgi:hypothetical protein